MSSLRLQLTQKGRQLGLLRVLCATKPPEVSDACRALSTLAPLPTPSTTDATHSRRGWQAVCWAAAAFLGSTGVALMDKELPEPPHKHTEWSMLSIEQRRRAFFKYEKRIRDHSPPEKIFEYFASQGDLSSGYVMTPSDMMRSVVPVYPPQNSEIVRAGCLPGEPNPHVPQQESTLFQKFDMDGDGGISFGEWLLFECLLAIPSSAVEVAFTLLDEDGSGSVDRAEFERLLASLQVRASHQHSASLRRSAVGDLSKTSGGLAEAFFGKNNKKILTLPIFKKFLDDLRDEMARLEFAYYDYKGVGVIGGADFAHSIIGCARLKHVDDYLARVDDLPPALINAQMSFKDFMAFRMIWRRVRVLAAALEFRRSQSLPLTVNDLQHIVSRVLNISLSPDVVSILFHLFPDGKGGLNTAFMLAVMDRHFETGMQMAYERELQGVAQAPSFLECMSKCGRGGN